MKTVILGLGNDLLSDDSIGLLVARQLSRENVDSVNIVESDLCGLALLDLLVDYDRAIIIDAMHTGKHQPGTILELGPDSFGESLSPSPHYTGLPELIALANELGLYFPRQIRIFAVEAGNLHTVGGDLSDPVAKALPQVTNRIRSCLNSWDADGVHG